MTFRTHKEQQEANTERNRIEALLNRWESRALQVLNQLTAQPERYAVDLTQIDGEVHASILFRATASTSQGNCYCLRLTSPMPKSTESLDDPAYRALLDDNERILTLLEFAVKQ